MADELRSILDGLKALGLDHDRPEEWHRIDFHIGMERALCLAEYGSHTDDRGSLREAIQIYKDIHGRLMARGGPEPLVKYRLGRAYALNRDPDRALACYGEGYALLKQGRGSLAKPDWLKVSLPKSIGYAYWTKANSLRQTGRNNGEEAEYEIEERGSLLAEAMKHTLAAFEDPESLETGTPSRVEIAMEMETLVNNLLSMALEYVELHGGDWGALAALTREQVDELAERLSRIVERDAGRETGSRHNRLDTLRLYGRMTGNADMERRFAEAVLDSVEVQLERGFKLKEVDCQMVEEAVQSLAGGQGAREPSPALRKACSEMDGFPS